MITLCSTDAVLAATQQARSVALTAYVMRPGRVLTALEEAAKRGVRVTVRLEASPFGDTNGDLHRENVEAVRALHASGADAHVVDGDGRRPLHLKAALVDNELFLDDRNWPDDGRDTIIRDTDPRDIRTFTEAIAGTPQNDAPLATVKDAALQREANVIYRAAKALQPVDVQSESFGFGRIYAALKTLAQKHVPVRLLVAERDLNANCASALQHLMAQGVTVRLSESDEKMAVARDTGWIGSANATMGIENQIDWGLDIFDRSVIANMHERFEENWAAAKPYAPGAT
ncbi:MAG: phosphatidylserine/phosphatidylglycerophosphate/cardiolipin synthase family protein [Candidatus Baltobacteraceae bacterium]